MWGGDADKQSDRQMETDRLTARRAVRGRDVEMKTIFGIFCFSNCSQTHTQWWRGGSLPFDRERQTRLQTEKRMSGTGVTLGRVREGDEVIRCRRQIQADSRETNKKTDTPADGRTDGRTE